MQKFFFITLLLLIISACGGGSGGDKPTPDPSNPNENSDKWLPLSPAYTGNKLAIQYNTISGGQALMRMLTGVDLLGNLMFGENYFVNSILPPQSTFSIFAVDEIVCSSGSSSETPNLTSGKVEVIFTNCKIEELTVNGQVNGFIGQTNLTTVNTDLVFSLEGGNYTVTGHFEYTSDTSVEASLLIVDNTLQSPVSYWFDNFIIEETGGFTGNIYSSDFGKFTIDTANFSNVNSDDRGFNISLINVAEPIGVLITGVAKKQAYMEFAGRVLQADLSSPYTFSQNNRAPVLALSGETEVRRGDGAMLSILSTFDPDVQPLDFTLNIISGPTTSLTSSEILTRSFSFTFEQKGIYELEVTASDPHGLSDSQILTYRVLPRDAEVSIGTELSLSGQSVSGSLMIDNNDTDGPFGISIVSSPKGTEFEEDYMRFTWTPPFTKLGLSQIGNFEFSFTTDTFSSRSGVEAELPARQTFAPKVLQMLPVSSSDWKNVGDRLFKIEAGVLFEVSLLANEFHYSPISFEFDPLTAKNPGTPVHVTDTNNDGNIEIWFADTVDNITVIDSANKAVIREFTNIDTNFGLLRLLSVNLNNDEYDDVLVTDGFSSLLLFGPSLGSSQDIQLAFSIPPTTTTCDINQDGINDIGTRFGVRNPLTNTELYSSSKGDLVYINPAYSNKACEVLLVVHESNNLQSINLLNLRTNTEITLAEIDDFAEEGTSAFEFSYWPQNIDSDDENELLLSFVRSQDINSSYATVALDAYSSNGPSLIELSDANLVVNTDRAEQVVKVPVASSLAQLDSATIRTVLLNEVSNDKKFDPYRYEALAIQNTNDEILLETIAHSSLYSAINIDLWHGNKAYGHDSENADVIIIDHSQQQVKVERVAMSGSVKVLLENDVPVYYQIDSNSNTVMSKYNQNFELLWQQILPVPQASNDDINAITSSIIMYSRGQEAKVLLHADTGEIMQEFDFVPFAADEANKPIILENDNTSYLVLLPYGQAPFWLGVSEASEISMTEDIRLSAFNANSLPTWQRMQLDDDPALEAVQIYFSDSGEEFLRSINELFINANGTLINEQPWSFSKQKMGIVQPCILNIAECAEFATVNTLNQNVFSIHDRDTHVVKYRTDANMPKIDDFIIRQHPTEPLKYQMLLNSQGIWLLIE